MDYQLIYNGSPNPASPMHSPTHTPSPTPSPAQTSPPLGYPVVSPLYVFPYQKLPPQKLQPSLNHYPVPPQGLGSPANLVSQPPMSVALSNPMSGNVGSPYWQQQLNYAQLSRQSASPHYHARQAAVTARNSNHGSSAVAITDPNDPNKPPVNGISTHKTESNGLTNVTNGKKDSPPGQQWMTIDLGGMGLKNISKELFRYNFLDTLYINHNNLTYIAPEISKLRNLTLLNISGNKLALLPPELGMLTNLKELLLFDNKLVNLPPELGTLYLLETLGLEGNPLNESISSLMQSKGTTGVITYLRDSCAEPPAPANREWKSLDNNMQTGIGSDTFTLLCYNILCDKYATGQQYGYTPSRALSWEYRKRKILEEVRYYDSDIVCLQEVDTAQYEDYFKRELARNGYNGAYWPKSRAKTMEDWEKKSVDGCATFYKSSKFLMLDKQLIEFNQVALQRSDFKKTDDMFNRVINKDNIAIVTLLENMSNGSRIAVVNCHIHWDPTYADVKLVQVAMLMDELDRLAQRWCTIPGSDGSAYSYTSSHKLATIICGDFNSTPDSGVYEFLSRNSVHKDHNDFGDHKYGAYTSEGLAHNFSLKSAYSSIEELPFTNFTPSFTGVIDYIWYSTNTLTVTGLLSGIDKEYSARVVGLPNFHFPSDHIVILAEFRIRPPQPNQATPQFGNGLFSFNNENNYNRRIHGGGNSNGDNNNNNNKQEFSSPSSSSSSSSSHLTTKH